MFITIIILIKIKKEVKCASNYIKKNYLEGVPRLSVNEANKTCGEMIGHGSSSTVFNVLDSNPPHIYKVIRYDEFVIWPNEIEVTKSASKLGVCPTFKRAFAVYKTGSEEIISVVIEMNKAEYILQKELDSKRNLDAYLKTKKFKKLDFYYELLSRCKELAENNIAYQDINFGNISLVLEGEKKSVQLIDFGNCYQCNNLQETLEKVLNGKVSQWLNPYMSEIKKIKVVTKEDAKIKNKYLDVVRWFLSDKNSNCSKEKNISTVSNKTSPGGCSLRSLVLLVGLVGVFIFVAVVCKKNKKVAFLTRVYFIWFCIRHHLLVKYASICTLYYTLDAENR